MSKSDSAHKRWGTISEINWLKKLGRGIHAPENAQVCKVSRSELIDRYVEACGLRKDWGSIEKEKVMGAAKSMLRHYGITEGL